MDMRVRAWVAGVCLVLAACSASGGGGSEGSTRTSGPTGGSTGKTTTTEQRATTTRPATTTTAATELTTSRYVHVEGDITIPDGQAGELSVALVGRPDGSGVPFVVRNRTNAPLQDISVTGTVRDRAGKLLGSGSSQAMVPSVVQPGEWGFGYVYFGTEDLPADAAFDLKAEGSPVESTGFDDVDLEVTEVSRANGEFGAQLVGIMRNTSDATIEGPIDVVAICFDGAVPTSTVSGFTDGDEVAAGATTSFSLDLLDASCPAFAIGGSGYNF
jgi:hypothetical protein